MSENIEIKMMRLIPQCLTSSTYRALEENLEDLLNEFSFKLNLLF